MELTNAEKRCLVILINREIQRCNREMVGEQYLTTVYSLKEKLSKK